MAQHYIPCLFMRGGSSRGPYFNRNHLPEDLDELADVLIAAVGAGHHQNIDGLGGGSAVTTKVAMLSPSKDEWADVDYFFAQVNVEEKKVDFSPTCGNILAGVGPAAITMGLVAPRSGHTTVKIHSVNTGGRTAATVVTENGAVIYEGDARIDGVPGTSSPINLNFMKLCGSKTQGLLPTGLAREFIQGVEVSLVDAAVPMLILRARDIGCTGYESAEELDANTALTQRLESMRLEAGELMGLGDVTNSVVPKMALLSAPQEHGNISARYYMPWKCHPTMAVTGGICIASCCLIPGSVAEGMATLDAGIMSKLVLEHPAGQIDITVEYQIDNNELLLEAAGVVRTARLIMKGDVAVSDEVKTASA